MNKITPKQQKKALESLYLLPKNTPLQAARMLINHKKVAQEQLSLKFNDNANELASKAHRISGAKTKPAEWQLLSAKIVADVFECNSIPCWGDDGQYIVFGGNDNAPKHALIALANLQRLLYNARRKCLSQFTRSSITKKRQLGDLFAINWLKEVSRKIKLLQIEEQPLVKPQSQNLRCLYINNLGKQINQLRTVGA